jgi:hypothetical protein
MACAEHDALAPLPMVEALQGFFPQAGVAGAIELHPGVPHGFAFPQRWCDDKPAAERHWERLLALYQRRLTALPSGGQRSGHARGQGGGPGGRLSGALAYGASGAHHGDPGAHGDAGDQETVSFSQDRGGISATFERGKTRAHAREEDGQRQDAQWRVL